MRDKILGFLWRLTIVMGIVTIPWNSCIALSEAKDLHDFSLLGAWGFGILCTIILIGGGAVVLSVLSILIIWLVRGNLKDVDELMRFRWVRNVNIQWIMGTTILLVFISNTVLMLRYETFSPFSHLRPEAIWNLANTTIFILTLTIIYHGTKNRDT